MQPGSQLGDHPQGPEQQAGDRYQALVSILNIDVEERPLTWVLDEWGRMTECQAWCAFTGQDPERIQGNERWLEAISLADRRQIVSSAWLESGTIFHQTCRILRADGRYQRFSLRLAPVKSGVAHVREWVGLGLPTELGTGDILSPEEELSSSKQLRGVLDILPVGIYILNASGKVLHRNATANLISGQEAPAPEEINGYEVFRGWWPGSGEPLQPDEWPVVRTLRLGEYVSGIEIEIEAFDGQRRTTLNSAVPIYNDGGDTVLGAALVVIDITERKKLEREVSERASQFAAIFEAITDNVYVYDHRGHIVQMNRAAQRFLARFVPEELQHASLEQRFKLLTVVDETGKPLPLDRLPTYRILRGEILPDGKALDQLIVAPTGERLWLSVAGAPLRSATGQITGGVVIYRDITERQHQDARTHETLNALLAMAATLVALPSEQESVAVAQDDLSDPARQIAHRLAELMRSVLGCERIGIQGIEPETEVLYPLAVVGLSPADEAFWWKEQRKQRSSLKDTPDRSLVERLRANEVLIVDMMSAPYEDVKNPFAIKKMLVAPMCISNQLVGMLTLDYGIEVHEYTAQEKVLSSAVAQLAGFVIERERLLQERELSRSSELALREANQRMDEFLGIASHELKTPITTIKGNVQLAARRVKLVNDSLSKQAQTENAMIQALALAQELLMRTNNQVDRLTRLVNDLLDVSRIQAQQLEIHLETCNLLEIVSEAVEDQQRLMPTRTITLETRTTSPLLIRADQNRINQVITNYLTNAIKYSAAEQPINVILEIEGLRQVVRVTVEDHGPGLPLEEQERIWERFYRAPNVEVLFGSGVGLGVGLHICATIIVLHAGRVGVESQPGQGSRFWFELPLLTPGEPGQLSEQT